MNRQLTLTDEAVIEVQEGLHDYYLDFMVNPAVVRAAIEPTPSLVGEVLAGTWTDTNIREEILGEVTRTLVGRTWPTYGDEWSNQKMDEFQESLAAANMKWS